MDLTALDMEEAQLLIQGTWGTYRVPHNYSICIQVATVLFLHCHTRYHFPYTYMFRNNQKIMLCYSHSFRVSYSERDEIIPEQWKKSSIA